MIIYRKCGKIHLAKHSWFQPYEGFAEILTGFEKNWFSCTITNLYKYQYNRNHMRFYILALILGWGWCIATKRQVKTTSTLKAAK